MLRHETRELADELRVPAERELGVDPVFERGEAQLLEAHALRVQEIARELG
jgi:hypothetical protein